MKVVFLGVGEAFDEKLPNTSVWIRTEAQGNPRSILLDCGFTVPALYWLQTSDPEDLDAIWISHFHGDHFFGMPALLLRLWEMKRTRPLIIAGQDGIEEVIRGAVQLAYPNFLKKLAYPLDFVSVRPGEARVIAGLEWGFAINGHGQQDLAVRIADGERSVFYSGDGEPTPDTLSLARGCDLVIHEAFRLKEASGGHGTVSRCIDFAREAGVRALALVHVQREERRDRYQEILRTLEQADDLHALLPEPGDMLEF